MSKMTPGSLDSKIEQEFVLTVDDVDTVDEETREEYGVLLLSPDVMMKMGVVFGDQVEIVFSDMDEIIVRGSAWNYRSS